MGTTVTVGCKLPHGLIMELPGKAEGLQPAPVGKRVEIKGANSLRLDRKEMATSYDTAFTPVEEEFARAWFKRYADMTAVKGGMIFIREKQADAVAQGKEMALEATGLEGLNPKGDQRAGNVPGRTAKEEAAKAA